MIGNDIVDLGFAARHSKWKHPRFMSKLFTDREQELIRQSSNSFSAIWHLWAIKEAAYKTYVQQHRVRFYSPKAFVCSGLGQIVKVSHKDFIVEVKSFANRDFVYTETLSNRKIRRGFLKVTSDYRKQSENLRELLLNDVSKSFNLERHLLNLVKDDSGVPKLYLKDSRLDVELSLTHHGSFAAYSLAYS